jgi:hypothetical protein
MYFIDFIVSPLSLLKTLPVLLIVLVLFFFVGEGFILLCNSQKKIVAGKRSEQSVFWSLFTGFLLTISIYATVITGFQTILLPIPLLLFFFIRSRAFYSYVINAHNLKEAKPFYRKNIFLFGIITALAYWCYFIFGFVSFANALVSFFGGDTEFYGRAAHYLNYGGKENISLDYLKLTNTQTEPYHYGDLWLTAFISRIFQINSVIVVPTITYPVFATIFIVALTEYCIKIFDVNFKKAFLFVIILAAFISGFKFIYPKFILNADVVSLALLEYPKTFLPACILMSMLISLRFIGLKQLTITGCIGVLLFINIAPAIIIAIFSISLVFYFIHKRQKLPDFIISFLVVLVTISFFLLFYSMDKSGISISRAGFNFKTAANIFFGGLLQYFSLIPFLVLFVVSFLPFRSFFKKAYTAYDIIFLFLISLTGLLTYSLLYSSTPEAVQFFTNVFIPAGAIAVCLILLHVLAQKLLYPKLISIGLFITIVILNFHRSGDSTEVHTSDLKKIKDFLGRHTANGFVNFRSAHEFKTFFEKNTIVFQPLTFLSYLNTPYINVSFNIREARTDPGFLYSNFEKDIIKQSPFALYQKKNGGLSAGENINKFIWENKFQFISVSPFAAIPPALNNFIKDSVFLTGGWKVYYVSRNSELLKPIPGTK